VTGPAVIAVTGAAAAAQDLPVDGHDGEGIATDAAPREVAVPGIAAAPAVARVGAAAAARVLVVRAHAGVRAAAARVAGAAARHAARGIALDPVSTTAFVAALYT
jgi:hypothetical protein